MFRRSFSVALPILVTIAALSVGAYSVYDAYLTVKLEDAQAAAQQQKLESAKTRLRAALGSVPGVSALALEKGFWYSYKDSDGNESVFYFNLDSAAADDLSDAQVASLESHLASSSILGEGSVSQVLSDKLPSDLQFHNALYSSTGGGESTLDIGKQLAAKVQSAGVTSDDLLRLSYLDELNGDYAARDALNKQNCTQFKTRCTDTIRVTIKGRIVDSAGAPIQGASIDIVSRPEVRPVVTDQKGMYIIETGAKDMEKFRIHAHKRNFSDGYEDTVLLQGSAQRTLTLDDIQLESPISIITIDYIHRSVTGSGNTFNADASVSIQTSRSTYRIQSGAIVHKDGSAYAGGTVDVYLYEFTKANPPANLMELDTFDAVRGYAGNLMKSFGMPYIQFFADGGEELHVLKSKPMTLTYRISDMDALRNNTDKIYRALTDTDMDFLVKASVGQLYRIDRQFLIDNQMLQFPAFWVFDRKRGVWDNVGVSVLDTQGTIKTIFYTIRDAI